jgi:Leucine-rich repeat (LRR) protein
MRAAHAIEVLISMTVCVCAVSLHAEPPNLERIILELSRTHQVEFIKDKRRSIVSARIDGDKVKDVRVVLKQLCEIKTLQELTISRSRIDRESLETLARLPNLLKLSLAFCHFEERDLEALKDLRALRDLDLATTSVTDSAMVHLKPLKKLERLRLVHLQTLPLKTLEMELTPISDESLQAVGKIQTLQVLDLHDTKVSDVGLNNLVNLYRLRVLHLGKTVTADGERNFLRGLTEAQAKARDKGLLPKEYPLITITRS